MAAESPGIDNNNGIARRSVAAVKVLHCSLAGWLACLPACLLASCLLHISPRARRAPQCCSACLDPLRPCVPQALCRLVMYKWLPAEQIPQSPDAVYFPGLPAAGTQPIAGPVTKTVRGGAVAGEPLLRAEALLQPEASAGAHWEPACRPTSTPPSLSPGSRSMAPPWAPSGSASACTRWRARPSPSRCQTMSWRRGSRCCTSEDIRTRWDGMGACGHQGEGLQRG